MPTGNIFQIIRNGFPIKKKSSLNLPAAFLIKGYSLYNQQSFIQFADSHDQMAPSVRHLAGGFLDLLVGKPEHFTD